MSIEEILNAAHAKTTSGRDGRAVSSDGILDVKLTTPRAIDAPLIVLCPSLSSESQP
jgi:hypothetical protein